MECLDGNARSDVGYQMMKSDCEMQQTPDECNERQRRRDQTDGTGGRREVVIVVLLVRISSKRQKLGVSPASIYNELRERLSQLQ